MTVASFGTEPEAVTVANNTRYGLNAMVFTQNLSRAHRVSAALRAGTVWVNCFSSGTCGRRSAGRRFRCRQGGTFSREFFTEPKAFQQL